MTEDMIRERVKAELKEKRFRHVEGVVQTADRLARIHGANPEHARLAAWIHDFCRQWPKEKLVQTAKDMNIEEQYFEMPELLHGHIAAGLAPQEFGITDEDVLNAARFHTSGRTNMSLLEKVVYLADAIEPGRKYPAVEEIRKVAEEDLDLALALSFDNTIEYLIQRREPIFPLTVIARNGIWRKVKESRSEQASFDIK
ncbi:bis(5'-nucleosyl)-tetraphosphatase (symmetrical) YqeK [Effusibacillus lacus]|uniref:bis(5'-nucleosyl)-tetraphosphatase (symmetrical) n=1 Tax=Effusibacillus lacus TaxID=1348429 RepID=A0A292YJ92_9BACL|nr:bis(5'-nucleosyl)-tetraphosphatase (symmetrical) YqeK [Effusibacillus lacus]TCS72849.1 putative HD superfamily hydrolase involved in NAD metabolism [Effusibacillus lacus]GAX89226.1 phosphohydrolase [Effusibacillus lacus]